MKISPQTSTLMKIVVVFRCEGEGAVIPNDWMKASVSLLKMPMASSVPVRPLLGAVRYSRETDEWALYQLRQST